MACQPLREQQRVSPVMVRRRADGIRNSAISNALDEEASGDELDQQAENAPGIPGRSDNWDTAFSGQL